MRTLRARRCIAHPHPSDDNPPVTLPSPTLARAPKTLFPRRACAIFALLFLFITQYAKLVWYDRHHLTTYQDFPQYFMGGLIARTGSWDSLYPIPDAGGMSNPGAPGFSTLRPRYKELSEQYDIGDNTR